jgi:hypothetical protein
MAKKKASLIKPGIYTTAKGVVLEKPEAVMGIEHHSLAKKFKHGDIFLSSNPMLLGKMINAVSTLYSVDRKSCFSHAGFFVKDDATILEATYTVTESNFLEKYEHDNVLVGRHLEMNDSRFNDGMEKIKEHIGQWYPFHRLFLHVFNLAQYVHWNKVVCSELVSKFLFGAGLRDYKYYGVTPDHLCDEIERSLNKERTGPQYEIVFSGLIPTSVYKRCSRCHANVITSTLEECCPICFSKDSLNTFSLILPELIEYNNSKKV